MIMRSAHDCTPENAKKISDTIEQRCTSLCAELGFEIDVRVLSSFSEASGDIQALTRDADALIVNNEAYAENPDSIANNELRHLETIIERKIPVIEVHETNIFSNNDCRPYLDSPGIGAGLVSGMGLHSYAVAIRTLASKTGSA